MFHNQENHPSGAAYNEHTEIANSSINFPPPLSNYPTLFFNLEQMNELRSTISTKLLEYE